MKFQAKIFLGFSALAFTLAGPAQASGPSCINGAKIRVEQPCDDDNYNTSPRDCSTLTYTAQGAWGEEGGRSIPYKKNADIDAKIEKVRAIFKKAKAENGGRLAYCLENVYYRGKTGYGRTFTVEQFLDTMIEEDTMRKEAIEAEKQRQARIRKAIEETDDLAGESSRAN